MKVAVRGLTKNNWRRSDGKIESIIKEQKNLGKKLGTALSKKYKQLESE